MCVLKKYPGLLAEVAKGVINNLPGQPAAGVTTIRSIKGHSANVSHGNEEGKYNATVNFSAKISAFFEF
ncbi:MAG: hypothetical protein Q8L10_00835 [Candidatus Moranbacteria bacterium]|nr:hypothetical protein [Candidatus Moranbacteria bacterium]